MRSRSLLAVVAALLPSGGCASRYATPPLPMTDPGNPAAAEAPVPPPSQTLVIAGAAAPPPATDPTSLMPEMKGMHHDHAMPGMKHEVPTTRAGENAAPSAPRWTPTTAPATNPAVKYTCVMHREVVTDQPGKCPKCAMKLVPQKQADESHDHHDHGAKGGRS